MDLLEPSVRGIGPLRLAIVGLLLAALHGNPVRAEIDLQGSAEAVRLEARDATVGEILAALGARFELHYRGNTSSQRFTATYEGPLRGILARVLEGYAYVIEPTGAKIGVIVLSTGSPRQATPARPAVIVHRRED